MPVEGHLDYQSVRRHGTPRLSVVPRGTALLPAVILSFRRRTRRRNLAHHSRCTPIRGRIRTNLIGRAGDKSESLVERSRISMNRALRSSDESHDGIEFSCAGPGPMGTALQAGTGNSQFLHFVDQRSALQAKFGSSSFGAADHPTNSFQCL